MVKVLRRLFKSSLSLFVAPAILALFLLRKFIVVELVLPNVTLFGHLALEPEKILSNIEAECNRSKDLPKRILIWSFSKPRTRANQTLVRMWRRQVFSLPSAVVDAIHRTSKWLPNFEIKILPFDKLHENDHVLDLCPSHLKFSKAEQLKGEDYLRQVGIKPGSPYVCFIVREALWAPPTTGLSSSGALRSRSFEDFLLAANAFVAMGVAVIKLGARGTFQIAGTEIIDYANSPAKCEFLDVYLPVHSACAVSTMSGPDAVALVGRVPVLYIDIAQYSLCFAGSKLVSWVPALLYSQKLGRAMSLTEAFESGAGRFLGAAAFEQAGISIIQSTPEQIRDYCQSWYENLHSLKQVDELRLQSVYRNIFHGAMSQQSVAKLEPFNSNLSKVFLQNFGNAFLA